MKEKYLRLGEYINLNSGNVYDDWWTQVSSTNTIFEIIDSLELLANEFAEIFKNHERRNSKISDKAIIGNNVYIGSNCKIYDFAIIRDNTIIMDNVVIGHSSEVARSVIFSGTNITHKASASGCLIGKNVNISAVVSMSTASIFNRDFNSLDKTIKIKFPDGAVVDTGLKKFGSVIGDDVRIGSNVCLNPGTLISRGCIVYPGTVLPSGVYVENTVIKLRQNLEIESKDSSLENRQSANFNSLTRGIPFFKYITISSDGQHIYYPECVAALCVNEHDEVVLVKQFRKLLNRFTYELPGGIVDKGETPLLSIKREILEEIGHSSEIIEHIYTLDMDVAVSKHAIQIFLAKVQSTNHEVEKGCEVIKVRVADLLNFIINNKITHAATVATICWYLNKISLKNEN